MNQKLAKKINNQKNLKSSRAFSISGILILFFLSLFFTTACFRNSEKGLEVAKELENEKKYSAAIRILDRLTKRHSGDDIAVRAAREAAKISIFHLKDYKKAREYFKLLVLYSPDEAERYRSQLEVARISFEHLSDYKQSIVEYGRLLEVAKEAKDKIQFRKKIARSYFFLKNFFQAEVELKQLAQMAKDKDDLYDILFLKGNIKMTTKKTDEAIEVFTRIIEEFPDRSRKDSVPIHLAICYEEKENYSRAIEILDEMKIENARPDFIEEKIQRLKLRQSFLPGAKGLRK